MLQMSASFLAYLNKSSKTARRRRNFFSRNNSMPIDVFVVVSILPIERTNQCAKRINEMKRAKRDKDDGGVLKMLPRRAILVQRGPAVSRDNWDTLYYRLRAIYAVRGV